MIVVSDITSKRELYAIIKNDIFGETNWKHWYKRIVSIYIREFIVPFIREQQEFTLPIDPQFLNWRDCESYMYSIYSDSHMDCLALYLPHFEAKINTNIHKQYSSDVEKNIYEITHDMQLLSNSYNKKETWAHVVIKIIPTNNKLHMELESTPYKDKDSDE